MTIKHKGKHWYVPGAENKLQTAFDKQQMKEIPFMVLVLGQDCWISWDSGRGLYNKGSLTWDHP